MTQNYPVADIKVKLDNEYQWSALETLRSGFSGTSAPLSPTPMVGQRYYNTEDKKWYVYVDNGDGTYSWIDESYVGAVASEIMAARGILPSLNARLSVLLGANGMPVLPVTQNVNEWADPQITAEYVSATIFKCASGKASIFQPGIPLLVTASAATAITNVVSAEEIPAGKVGSVAYPAYTKVTIMDSLLNNTAEIIIKVAFAYSSLQPRFWHDVPLAAVIRTANDAITITGDVRAQYPAGKRLRFNGADAYLCRVFGAPTYAAGVTTITVWFDATTTIPATITKLERSRLTPQDTANGGLIIGTDTDETIQKLFISYCCGSYAK